MLAFGQFGRRLVETATVALRPTRANSVEHVALSMIVWVVVAVLALARAQAPARNILLRFMEWAMIGHSPGFVIPG